MGNSVTADCKLLDLNAITNDGLPMKRGGSPLDGCNVKAWRFSGKYRVACSEVDLTKKGMELDQNSTYLVLVLKGSGEVLADGAVKEVTGVLGELFTPRGIQHPFSDVRRGGVFKTIYAVYGKQSSSLAKAKLLKKALELEKRLYDTDIGESLFSMGHPVPIPTPLFSLKVPHPVSSSSPSVHLLHVIQSGATVHANPTSNSSTSSIASVASSSVDEPPLKRDTEAWSAPPLQGFSLPRTLPIKPVMPSMSIPIRKEDSPIEPPLARREAPEVEELPDEKQLHNARENKMRDASKKCSDILPYLAVSGQLPAENLDMLLSAGVTDIVNTAEMIIPCKYTEYFNYYALRMKDSPSENIFSYFPHCVAAVERAREKANGKILIHCHQGVSRSVTLVACYLMWRYMITGDEAIQKVKEGRDVARPNAGFAFRLVEWRNHLLNPGEVIVYRLAPFSDEGVVPPVLALEKFGDNQMHTLDNRTAYVVVFWREKKIWVWKGARCPTVYCDVAMSLVPEVAVYGMRTSPEGGSQLRWPEGVVENPVLVKQGAESEEVIGCLERAGCNLSAVGEQGCYDIYEDKQLGVKWHEWLDHRTTVTLAPGGERDRSTQRSQSHSSSRYLMEQLNIKDMYMLTEDGRFSLNDSYHENGLDEDDFFSFQETADTSMAVFMKLRGEDRILDLWIGEWAVDESQDPGARAETVIEEFKTWSKTETAWGNLIDWSTVHVNWVHDAYDEDADLRFQARWISS